MKYKAVCFDLDGTLITNTNSVEYLCTLNGKKSELDRIEELVTNKTLYWVQADYKKARLFAGLDISEIEKNFDTYVKLIDGIGKTVSHLRDSGVKTLLVSAGPQQVGEVVARRFGFAEICGSLYEVKENRYTGEVIKHLDENGKLLCLESFCKNNGISIAECAAVGDSISDVKIFERCGQAIAINYSEMVLGKAHVYLKISDLSDILKYLK